jgi:hypothetical protein
MWVEIFMNLKTIFKRHLFVFLFTNLFILCGLMYTFTIAGRKWDSGLVIAEDAATGAIGGGIPVKIPSINSGRNNHDAIGKQIATKLNNGTISNVSDKALAKIATGDAVAGGVDGIKQQALGGGGGGSGGCK